MKYKTMNILAAALVTTAAFANPAIADPHGKGPGRHHEQEYDHNRDNDDDVNVHVRFNDHDRERIRYYAQQDYREHCPPGLAKKHNGCMPPGQYKKRYVVGRPLPSYVVYQPVPTYWVEDLQPPPPGYEYVRVDNDVLLISREDRRVYDSINLNLNF